MWRFNSTIKLTAMDFYLINIHLLLFTRRKLWKLLDQPQYEIKRF